MPTLILKSNRRVKKTVTDAQYKTIMDNPMTAKLYDVVPASEAPEEVKALQQQNAAIKANTNQLEEPSEEEEDPA